jgi:hypothetical protein
MQAPVVGPGGPVPPKCTCRICSATALVVMDKFVRALKSSDQFGRPLFSPRELRKLRRAAERMGSLDTKRPNN